MINDDSVQTCEDWNRFLTSRMRTFGKSEDILTSFCNFKRPFDGYDLVVKEKFLDFPLVCFIGSCACKFKSLKQIGRAHV